MRVAGLLLMCALAGGTCPPAQAGDPPADPVTAVPMLHAVAGPHDALLVLGTLHLPDRRVATYGPLVTEALARSDEVLAEAVLDENHSLRLLPYVQLPRNRPLDTLLSPSLRGRIQTLLGAHGQDLDVWQRIRPWMLEIHLGHLYIDRAHRVANSLDVHLQDAAVAAGKPVIALETVAEQMEAYERMGLTGQVALLEESVARFEADEAAGRNPVEALVAPFLVGDLPGLMAEVRRYYDLSRPRDRRLYQALHGTRHARMLARLTARARSHPDRLRLVVVGAAHLAGEDGLLAGLRARGHVSWRVRDLDDLPRDPDHARTLAVARAAGLWTRARRAPRPSPGVAPVGRCRIR